jgi:hypothetical protein
MPQCTPNPEKKKKSQRILILVNKKNCEWHRGVVLSTPQNTMPFPMGFLEGLLIFYNISCKTAWLYLNLQDNCIPGKVTVYENHVSEFASRLIIWMFYMNVSNMFKSHTGQFIYQSQAKNGTSLTSVLSLLALLCHSNQQKYLTWPIGGRTAPLENPDLSFLRKTFRARACVSRA